MKKITALCALAFVLAGCADQRPPLPPPYNQTLPPKISFDVQTISLADRSAAMGTNDLYSSNHFSPTINDAIKQWATDRLQAVGRGGQAIVLIKDATITAQPLPVQTGIDSWFTRQQGVKYTASAAVSIEANGSQGTAMAEATATRAITLPEDPTPIEKQNAYFTLLNGLMKDLGQNLEGAIQTHMGTFIGANPAFGGTAIPAATPAPSSAIIQQPFDQQPMQDPMGGQGQVIIPLSGSAR